MFAVTGELLQAHVQFKETGADGGGGGSQLGRLVVAVMLMHDLGYILVQFFSQLVMQHVTQVIIEIKHITLETKHNVKEGWKVSA